MIYGLFLIENGKLSEFPIYNGTFNEIKRFLEKKKFKKEGKIYVSPSGDQFKIEEIQ
jgi:hypothetical protein